MLIKHLIFLYFILLIFEGALRKWIFPGLATPLLIVRDPVVIAIYLLAFQNRVFPTNNWVLGALALGVASGFAAMVAGHGNILVTAYGFRANFLHIPLIFVMARVLDQQDLRRYAKWMLLITLPMTALVVVQFLSPPTAFVNVGVGGEGTASFDGGGGRMRSSGTFSFIIGLVSFYSLAFACWAGLLLDRGARPPLWLLAGAGTCLLLAVPLSISRALLVAVGIVVAGCALVFLRMPGWGRMLPRLLLVGGVAFLALSQLTIFDEAMDAFGDRWDRSTTRQGGAEQAIFMRIIHDLTQPFQYLGRVPLLGNGIGAGTQGGAQLLRGERGFLGGEGEWWRLLWEMGIFLGSAFILYRFWLTVRLGLFGWRMLGQGNPFPWIFFLAAGPLVLSGQWGQPTQLGFAIFSAGMALAAGMERRQSTADADEVAVSADRANEAR
jgi:hypothetical protein